ncbi:MAG: hypothetical protein JST91_03250 [Actinobacteria bacterium]|nr:hypothetical protein [Actinomycetota bacterium]
MPYLQGQEDARLLFNAGRTPDWILIAQLDPNRAAGMRAEWAEVTGFGNITAGSHKVDIRTGRALGFAAQPTLRSPISFPRWDTTTGSV